MRRKGTESLAIEPIIHMVIKLILLMVGIAFITIVATGEGNKILGSIDEVMGTMGCKENLGSVDFRKFMEKMNDIHDNCAKDANKCGSKTCMALDLGAGGTYHTIDANVLHNYGVKFPLTYTLFGFGGPNTADTQIFCDERDVSGSDDINAYYTAGTYYYENNLGLTKKQIYADEGKSRLICNPRSVEGDPLFAVADNSKITLKATHSEFFMFSNTDLEITVKGGQFTNKVAAPAAPTCTLDSECTKIVPWGVCNDNHCVYDYCRNGKSPKCKEYAVVCERDDTPTTEESNTVNCEPPSKPMTCDLADTYFKKNTYTIEPYRMTGLSLDPKKPSEITTAIRFKVYDGNGASDIQGVVGSESAWMLNRWPLSWRTNEKDPTAKVSLSIGSVTGPSAGKFAASLLMGCY